MRIFKLTVTLPAYLRAPERSQGKTRMILKTGVYILDSGLRRNDIKLLRAPERSQGKAQMILKNGAYI